MRKARKRSTAPKGGQKTSGEEGAHGLFNGGLLCLFPGGGPALLPAAPPAAQRLSAAGQLAVLSLCRGGKPALPGSHQCPDLCGGLAAGKAPLPGPADPNGGGLCGRAGGVQIPGLRGLPPPAGPGGGGAGLVGRGAQTFAAGGHLLLLFRRHGLPDGRVPGQGAGGEELCPLRPVPLLLPLPPLGAHRPGGGAAAPV